jgi:Zn-dependent peptidase ImmA (M78 family)
LAGKDTNIGAKRARETRQELGLEAGSPVPCLLTAVEDQLRIPVVIASLPDGIAGCCWRDGERLLLWVNGTEPSFRQRFTLAHELGHVRCRHEGGVPVETIETLSGKTTDSREIQANAFSAELLAPADGVRAMVDHEPALEDVVLIAARYGISTIAALYRLNSLGLTERERYDRLKHQVENDADASVPDRLAPRVLADEIAAIDPGALPRLSPSLAGSALAGIVAGEVSVADAASAAGCDPRALADGAAVIGA